MNISIFQTNIFHQEDIDNIKKLYLKLFPEAMLFFDPEDCDRIFKVIADPQQVDEIVNRIIELGYTCLPLED